MDLLLRNIARHIQLDTEEQDYFISLLRPFNLRKKEFLFREDEINKYQAFVLSGCLRSYSVDKNGFEHILQFAPSDWWIADMRSNLTQQPGTLYIDAIFDSEMLLLYRTDLEKLYIKVPKFEHYFRVLAENALVTLQHRLIDNLSLTAKERYENFCKRYPSLIQSLPQKQVAAYIGVTPEFLSKMLNDR